MSFNPNEPKAEYQASAGQTDFPFLFKIYFTTDMKVYHTPISTGTTVLLTEGVDYSVAINGDDGGTVTLILVVENNDYIVLERELELTRYVEYQTSGDLLADTLNADQDYQTYLVSDQNALRDNSLYLPNGTFGVDTEIPFPVAGYFFRWNSTGTAVEYSAPSTVTVPWGNIDGTLSDQTDLQNELDSKADKTYVDSQDELKLPKNNPSLTGTLTMDGIFEWSAVDVTNITLEANGTPVHRITTNSKLLSQTNDHLIWGGQTVALTSDVNLKADTTYVDSENDAQDTLIGNNTTAIASKIEADDYATDLVGGTIKILVSGTDCYITTDGSTPGP